MENESKADRFKRIASKRTNDVLEKLRLLGNCANRNSYDYSDEDIERIFSELNKQLKITRQKFSPQEKTTFKL
mgnify:CR=1 FL=1